MQPSQDRDVLANERTLLAAERTFSAWIRTGLAGMGGGLAIARALAFKSYTHQVMAQAVGVLLVIWGASICVYAIVYYRRISQRLTQESIPNKPLRALMLMTVVLLLVAMLVLWIILMKDAVK